MSHEDMQRPAVSQAGSWWIGLGHEALNREAYRRFPGNEPRWLIMNDKGFFGDENV